MMTPHAFLALVTSCCVSTGSVTQPIQVGTHRQIFVDDQIIAIKVGVTLTLHQPKKVASNPVLLPDRPWEVGSVAIYGTVLYDEQDKCFKMWYRAIDDTCYACYATSDDGIRWTKPTLNLKPHKGSTENNIVLGGLEPKFYLDGFAVIKEPNDPDPRRRYKMLTYCGNRHFACMVSPDGLRWTGPINDVAAHDTGDVVSMYKDTGLNQYVALLKRRWVLEGKNGKPEKRRARLVSFSDDFTSWSVPDWALIPDEKDPPGAHIYSHVAYMYEGLRLGYISIFNDKTEQVDVQLCHSRDGRRWHRYRQRVPFIPVGPEGSFDAGSLYAGASGLVVRDGKIWIYYCGYNTDHAGRIRGKGPKLNGIGLAHLRLDGFVSADAGPRGGTLLTRQMACSGNVLHVNAEAPQGQIQAEILDATLAPLPGRDIPSSIPFKRDSTDATLRWKPGTAADVAGKPVSIRFHLKNAKLYSFWFADE
ncbi:MAG: hypothetical protein JXQ73_30265 [Phycisphaerae bacterium]|nr:hypothetical protein [Phycisphaerae bacterium]